MGLLDKVEADGSKKEGTASPKKPAPRKRQKPSDTSRRPQKARPSRRQKGGRSAATGRSMPSDYVLARMAARRAGRLVDFLVTWGLVIPALFLMVATTGDPTIALLSGILLASIDLFILPIWLGRSVGHFTARIKTVTHKGENPLFLYHIMAVLTLPIFVLGLIFLLMAADQGKSMVIAAVFCFLYVLADYIVRLLRSEQRQGLWEMIFGVYHVAHVPTGKEKGWVARLENLGTMAEERFAKKDGDETEESDEDDA